MSWSDSECGNKIFNPYCLNGVPTDPYSWAFLNDEWVQFRVWNSSITQLKLNEIVYNDGQFLICEYEQCLGWGPSGPQDNDQSMHNVDIDPDYLPIECPSGASAPVPDPQTGTCLKSPLSGTDAACVNPCIRLANGQLAVNRNSNQCRVFPGTTDGGIAGGIVTGSDQCTTVCPKTCVELWQTCPLGTAPISSLIQTKSPTDVLALTGPYRADGSSNPLWPNNYASSFNGVAPIGGKPYTECYSFNTDICEMPSARMETSAFEPATDKLPAVPAKTRCYATCPEGTFQDPNDSKQCLFKPIGDIVYDPKDQAENPLSAYYQPTTPVQRIFCNPQFYNPLYWDEEKPDGSLYFPGYKGTQKGCKIIDLPTKQGSSCGVGLLPIINENFNLEWCMPECPSGYFSDLSQSTCVATCQGSTGSPEIVYPGSMAGFNAFLDYVDFYATTNRCKESSHDPNIEQDCAQNYVHGRCPALQKEPVDSKKIQFTDTTSPENVLLNYKSINTQCPLKRLKDYTNGIQNNFPNEKFVLKALQLANITQYQRSYPTGPNKISDNFGDKYYTCPDGMVIGDDGCGENNNICYDQCAEGYEPVTSCNNGSTTCSIENTVYSCMAKCPASTEGLGPWKENNKGSVHTCEYVYPQVPSDPSLWVPCPDDGRFTVLQNSPTDISLAPEARTPPLCLRKTYLRQSACFVSTNPISDPTTGLTMCVAACNANDIVITNKDGQVVCQSVILQTPTLQLDLVAVSDSENAKPEFRYRTMTRLNLVRGYGTDPNVGIADPQAPKEPQWASFLKWGLIALAVIIAISFILPKSKG